MSLARAFTYTGVHNIVMTLWSTSDQRSSELMQDFYRYMLRGRSTSRALRRAKLDMLNAPQRRNQFPQYWAGYIFVGNDEVMYPGRICITVGAGILVTTVILVILLRRRRRGKAGL